MNSKAIKRQLLAAIAMVLVAAIALGSSTYAWFVASGTVKAEGMKVNVQAEGGLIIRYAGAKDGWGVVASAGVDRPIDLLPASTADMTTWCTASAAQPGSWKMSDSTIKPVTVAQDATNITNNNYVVKHTFEIRATNASSASKGLYVKNVTVTAAQQVNKALRIGIVASGTGVPSNGGKFIMAPARVGATLPTNDYTVYTATASGTAYTPTAVTTPVHWVDAGTEARILPAATSVPAGKDSDVIKVAIFIWFEGEERALFSDNVHAADDLDISLEFTTDTMDAGSAAKVDLTNAEAVDSNTIVDGATTYYPIAGKSLNSKQLYATAKGAITSSTSIYTVTVGEGSAVTATDVTTSCTLPS